MFLREASSGYAGRSGSATVPGPLPVKETPSQGTWAWICPFCLLLVSFGGVELSVDANAFGWF